MTVGIGTSISVELLSSAHTSASNAADSSQLTWESTNKSSWVDYVAANSSDGQLNSTATYQTEAYWNNARKRIYDSSYDTTYNTAINEAVGDS